jgi:hypothetical protein
MVSIKSKVVLFKHHRENYNQAVDRWNFRFIDDVDMKWTQRDDELQNFLSRANNLHPSIKFTHEISNTTISFQRMNLREYRRWWSLSVKRNIRRFNYNYSFFVDL